MICLNCFTQAKRIVVKVGTSTLTWHTGRVNIRRMEQLISVLADLANSGRELVVVTSGAISVGLGKLGIFERPDDIPTRQAAAAVGQCELMYLYDNMFTRHNHTVAQVLMTIDTINSPSLRDNAINTFERLLSLGAIPIVNENDAVAVEELVGGNIGDNDTLSAVVAQLVQADALVLVSDIEGLYSENPRDNPAARLIHEVYEIDDHILAMASGTGSNRGTGGMTTKVQAARIAMESGIDMAIISGENPSLLYDLFDGKPIGTHFVAVKGRKVQS